MKKNLLASLQIPKQNNQNNQNDFKLPDIETPKRSSEHARQ